MSARHEPFFRRLISAIALVLAIASCSSTPPAPRAPRPLDPLEPDELRAAVEILRADGKLSENVSIVTLSLDEPAKRDADRAGRIAFAVLHDRPAHATFEARVDLSTQRVVAWKEIPGAEPMVMSDEFERAAELVRADERWRAALQRRGVDDFERVYIDVWSPGEPTARDPEGVRLLRAIANLKGVQQNSYGPPIEGVVATVDMTHRRVIEVIDADEVPFSRTSTDFYDPRVRGEPRAAADKLAPAKATASNIAIDGHDLAWQKWRMHWSINAREGLVLHRVGYADGGRVRSILYRASIAEMWVPYGDPSETWTWRNAFDEGEYGLGAMANTLVAGRDVPENALLFDAAIVAANGEVGVQPGLVAVYERDGGLLWSHKDDAAGTEARRATELVLRFVATAGNYDYGFQWIFRQDGTLAFEMDLTGILLTKGVEATQCQICRAETADAASTRLPKGDEAHGTIVADHVVATNHQHFVSLRLDFDVDGPRNRVQEIDVKSASPEADNRGFVVERVPLRTESEARRDVDLATHRTWLVTSGDARNATGHATGYAIVPEGNALPYLGRATRERALAGFVEHHLWVTREHAGELYASGDYPSQGGKPGGLAAFASDDESLEDEDLVVWYTLGVTHVPRPEDYPVMPVEHAGVRLVPHGFFDRNPALDVP